MVGRETDRQTDAGTIDTDRETDRVKESTRDLRTGEGEIRKKVKYRVKGLRTHKQKVFEEIK